MAKDKKTDFSSLLPKAKQAALSAPAVSADDAIRQIHGDQTRRITLDIPIPLHGKIKLHCFQRGISMKDFLLDLAARELGA